MFEIIQSVILWTLSTTFSVVAIFKLLKLYVTKLELKPWKLQDHLHPPASLSDPKYGAHKFVTVNGIRLHYVEAGDPSKPLMLFLHGFPEFWYSWRNQIVEFSKDYWTVALDMRGFSLSDRPVGIKNYAIQYLVDDLRAVIQHLNRKKFILVAHDWGALVAWEFVSQHKQMVYKYCCMGGPSCRVFRKTFLTKVDQFLKSWYMLLFQMPILPELILMADNFALFTDLCRDQLTKNVTEEDFEAYKYMISRPGALTAGINYYRANFGPYNNLAKLPNRLDGSDGMYVLGNLEKYISKETLKATAKEYPKIRIEVIPDASHFLQQHNPKAINSLLRDFLGSAANECPVESIN